MTGRRVLPPAHVLREWRQQGLTAEQCLDELRKNGMAEAELPTPNALYTAWSRMGEAARTKSYDEDIPWVIKPRDHKNANIARLRNVGRMRHYMTVERPVFKELFDRWIGGEPLTEEEVELFDQLSLQQFPTETWQKEFTRFSNWWRKMRANEWVVTYSREEGVKLAKAREGIDRGFIRELDADIAPQPRAEQDSGDDTARNLRLV